MIQLCKGEETARFTLVQKAYLLLSPKICEIVPCEIKNTKSLDIFKEKIKLWKTDKCPFRLCKRHIGNLELV